MFFLRILLALSSAFAIENLPCQRYLGAQFQLPNGKSVTLEPDQLLIRGNLFDFWETGMEDQTGWSIIDEVISKKLSGDPYDSLFALSEGDLVFLLRPDGSLLAEGVHHEFFEQGKVSIAGRDIDVWPNRPVLRKIDPRASEVISTENYMKHFANETPAVAVVRLSNDRINFINGRLKDKWKDLAAHEADPSRFIPIGSGLTYERRLFEQVFLGTLLLRDDGHVTLATQSEPMQLKFGDILYLMDDQNAYLGLIKMRSYPAQVQGKDRDLVARSKRTVLVRRLSD